MCGIAGYWSRSYIATLDVGKRMAEQIKHRGPDDAGAWIDQQTGLVLVHRRLSIVDLSSTGHQPMISASGRFVIIFNGEIYNHLEIKGRVQQNSKATRAVWRGHSDTEILLAAIEMWGLEKTLQHSVGMFALALWDREERVLHIARDRMGEKPLYYGWQNGVFLFGSELKALRVHPSFVGEINRDAIALQLRYSYIPAPYSIYEGIYKLLPGTVLSLQSDCLAGYLPQPQPYWSLQDVMYHRQNNLFKGSDAEAVELLHSQLQDAVAQQMIADVPIGAFLSGGIDSSTIVALMQAQSSKPVKTFSIGFDTEYNEAVYAKAVAEHLGTEHTELYLSSNQALAVIPRLATLYDEPFSDPSQIPTFLVSAMTKENVKVSLSGDAGDELFGGYNRYLLTDRLWGRLSRLPVFIRSRLAAALLILSPDQWDHYVAFIQHLLPTNWQLNNVGHKLHKSADVLDSDNLDELYLRLVSHWEEPASVVIGGHEPTTVLARTGLTFSSLSDIEHMMMLDAVSYLPDDILAKVDRAAMGVGLETRVPFLDHRVVELAWRLPLSLKIRNGQSKWILRQILHKYVPKELIERPKMGFGIPIDNWLRDPLRDWAESLLNETRLRQDGFFDPLPIRQKWVEHLSGRRNWQHHLWNVLMFQAWYEQWA